MAEKIKRKMNALKNKAIVGAMLVASMGFLFVPGANIAEASNATTLSTTVNAGSLSVDIVDGSNVTVGSPSVTFGAVTFNFDSAQNATGSLGTASQKIRVANGRASPAVAWTLTMAATSGNTTLWSGGAGTLDFNSSGAAGQLTVDPSGGTITPTNAYTSTGLTKGSSTAFVQGTTDSVTLLSASTSASQPGRWDFTGVSLSQSIPALTQAATYTIGMTLTVT